MCILVINTGSSTLKFACFDDSPDKVLVKGMVDRIGQTESKLHYQTSDGVIYQRETEVKNIRGAVELAVTCLTEPGEGALKSPFDIKAIGHRIVHGGPTIDRPQVLDRAIKQLVKDHSRLAPLHNPANLAGIEAAEAAFPKAIQVGVFDTAFHSTLPPKAYLYALPLEFYQQEKIRRYGFHGISHKYVSEVAAEFIGKPLKGLNLITCHLGNGCSITAVKAGVSVDTSMGFTPLEGLVMGTRSGDLDPAILIHLMEHKGLSVSEVKRLINHESGLLGLSAGVSCDMRELSKAAMDEDKNAKLAMQVFCYRIRKYIGAYCAAMGWVDGIIFTGGIGENSAMVRQLTLQGLEAMNITLNHELNHSAYRGNRYIQAANSDLRILVVPTDEEKEIASQVRSLLDQMPLAD